MRNAARSIAGVAIVLAAAGFSAQGSAQPAPQAEPASETCCNHPQSPRSLTGADWNYTSTVSTVLRQSDDSVRYAPRAGVQEVLHRCSQHYHCRIENVQGCAKESAAPAAGQSACPARPVVGSWVEVHTVYHLGPTVTPTPEGLEQCDPATLVVVGYQAQVTTAPVTSPIPVHFELPAAEWTGSSTGVDKPPPPECKVAAFWRFALGCNFRLSEQQLVKFFMHPEEAREIQPPNRRSRDLTHIVQGRRRP